MSANGVLQKWASRAFDDSYRATTRVRLPLFRSSVVSICLLASLGILLTAVHVTSALDHLPDGGARVKALLQFSDGGSGKAKQPAGTAAAAAIASINRTNDFTDVYAGWRGRQECGFGATDLHQPLPDLCTSPQQLFDAMGNGQRTAGYNAPFQPDGCDLHFFDTAEVCEILGRFEKIIFIGDSLMRQTEWSVSMLMQENYYDGGQNDWMDVAEEDCKCAFQTASMFCLPSETSTELLYRHSPSRILCPNKPQMAYRPALKWPLPQDELEEHIANVTAETRPDKPYAMVFGHATWNDCNDTATLAWMDQVTDAMAKVRPYLAIDNSSFYPRSFISASASGWGKPEAFIATQGNEAVPIFQAKITQPIIDRGIDFLSPFNMSIDALIPDGTHTGIRVNLLKSMTLVNWLNMIDTRRWNNALPPNPPAVIPPSLPRTDMPKRLKKVKPGKKGSSQKKEAEEEAAEDKDEDVVVIEVEIRDDGGQNAPLS